jgi:hypothetical protein
VIKINPNKDKTSDRILQDLKIEYYKYKNNLQTIIEAHKNLKNRIDKEKSTNNILNIQSNEFNCVLFLI